MILPGKIVMLRGIISNILSQNLQVQPCGIDLTLKRILTFTSSGTIDLTNQKRKNADTKIIPFSTTQVAEDESIQLVKGSYLVEFNELVNMPLDVMGQIFVRSSLFRSGAVLEAGVMDCGYRGVIGALLRVDNVNGLKVYRNARLGQMVFQEMREGADGYAGVYQGRKEM